MIIFKTNQFKIYCLKAEKKILIFIDSLCLNFFKAAAGSAPDIFDSLFTRFTSIKRKKKPPDKIILNKGKIFSFFGDGFIRFHQIKKRQFLSTYFFGF